MAGRVIRKVLQAAVNKGAWGFCVLAVQAVARRVGLGRVVAPAVNGGSFVAPSEGVHPFDREFGTETSGLAWGEDLPSRQRNDIWNTAYYGVSPSVFTQAIEALGLDWERFTFVDLGSGKGRALLLASRFPFRRIVGVELVPELCAVAAANVERFRAEWQRCGAVEAWSQDATAFEFPDGPLVVYIYHPFLSPVLKRVMRNLRRSLVRDRREVYLVYFNPVFARVVERECPELQLIWERRFAMSAEDVGADWFQSVDELVRVFRYAG